MSKIELAKMLGLELESYSGYADHHDIKTLLELDYMTIDWNFSSDIKVVIEQEDLSEDKLNIELSDLVKDGDIEVCVKQVKDLMWERAADEYLGKIKSLVETITV